jgi:O-antigen ligase
MWLFIHRPFEVWPWLGDLRVERVYMVCVVVAWIASDRKRWLRNRINAAFCMFFLVMLASWSMSSYGDVSTKKVEDYAKTGVLFLLVMSSVRNEADLKRLVAFFLLAVGLYACHSLREYFNGKYVWRMGTSRMVGVDTTSGDPNTFAGTLIYSLPMALPFWYTAQTLKETLLILAYIVLCAVCILLTGSRTAFPVLMSYVLIMVLASKHRIRMMVLLAAALMILWNALPEDRQNRYLTLIDPSYGPQNAQRSAETRSELFWEGVALWQTHSVLGVGPGAFAEATGQGIQAHNLFGEVLGELGSLGALGLAAIVLCFVLNYRDARRIAKDAPECAASFSHYVVISTLCTTAFLVVMGLGGHNLYRYNWMWMGAFQAIALHVLQQAAFENEVQEKAGSTMVEADVEIGADVAFV